MRVALRKSERWSVFDRDNFTCCYCGRRPPDVVLVVDHVVPVAAGGDNAPENLATSCVECNAGKGAKPLGSGGTPVDQDALARAAQEVAERTLLLRDLYTAKDDHSADICGAVDQAMGKWHLVANHQGGEFGENMAAAFDRQVMEKLFRRGLSMGQFDFAMDVMLAKWRAVGPRSIPQLWYHVTGICWDTVHYREQGR